MEETIKENVLNEVKKDVESVSGNEVVEQAVKKLVSEEINARSGAVYKLIQKQIATQNEVKRLTRELEKAKVSLDKTQEILERVKKNGDFSWMNENKNENKEIST